MWTTPVRLIRVVGRRGRRPYSTKSWQRQTVHKLAPHVATACVFATAGVLWATSSRGPQNLRSVSTDELIGTYDSSPDAITRLLSRDAQSHSIPISGYVSGVNRYDTAQLAANIPCEDRSIHGELLSLPNRDKQLVAWGVFDGHAGWQTSDFLTKELLPSVQTHLNQVRPSKSDESERSIQQAIVEAFVELDDSIVKTALATAESEISLPEKMQKLVPAYAGSCALLSVYDPNTTKLHVACTGDSRAVLGRRDPNNGKWSATPLSVDQNAKNRDEVARIEAEHPGEVGIAKGGRILGIVISRAFGDCQWKWPVEMQRSLARRFYGYGPLPGVVTPPYLTAEPVVTSTPIDPEIPSFLIMASDGLWEKVSSEEAVGLVGAWLSSLRHRTPSEAKYEPFDFSHCWKGVNWRFDEDRTTVQDENVAVHLIRNVLGGNHQEMLAGRLTLGAPFARRLRDDITVQVVFFNVPGVGEKK